MIALLSMHKKETASDLHLKVELQEAREENGALRAEIERLNTELQSVLVLLAVQETKINS